jgi:hypothetical protein
VRRTLLILLVALSVLVWRADGSAQGEPPKRLDPHRTADLVPPAPPEPLTCEGATAVACQHLRAVTRADPKRDGLAWPLAELAEAQMRLGGAQITASRAGLLPKSLQDMIAAQQMRLDHQGRVQVFVRGEATEAMAGAVESQGATVQRVSEEHGIVQAWVPVERISSVEALPGVRYISLPDYAVQRVGSVTTQGDTLLNVAEARSAFGYDGTGVRVGVVSDGVAGLAASQTSGDLPAVNTATCDVGTGSPTAAAAGAEGTAMLEIVHDLAPAAELWFGYAGLRIDGTMLDFMATVTCLAQNVDVVVDDIGFYNVGPYDGSSSVSINATRTMEKSNRARSYLTAVGNDATSHYQGAFVDAGGAFPGFHLFARVPATTGDAFDIGPEIWEPFYMGNGGFMCTVLQWNDPFTGSHNNYDMILIDVDRFNAGLPDAFVELSQNPQTGSQPPVEALCFENAGPEGFFSISIVKVGSAQPRLLDLFFFCDFCAPLPTGLFGQPFLNFNTACSSISNNSDARPPVISLGALDATVPPANQIEPYSSCGPTEDGRIKPEAAGVDGVDVTGNGGYPDQFFGTSAAAPHGAAIVALLLDCQPNLSPMGVRSILMETATNLGPPGVDNRFGAGRLNALNALTNTTCLIAKDPGADSDGDALLNSADADDDNDGCLDTYELSPMALQGGRRDPHNAWDFFDVPAGGALVRDGVVSAADLASIVARFGSAGSPSTDPLSMPPPAPAYHTAYDRGAAITYQNPWNLLPANGTITAGDVAAAVSQFGHGCN